MMSIQALQQTAGASRLFPTTAHSAPAAAELGSFGDGGGVIEMDVAAVREWLAEPRPALITAVAEEIREHVSDLWSQGNEFYGYALCVGEWYDLGPLSAITNTEENINIKVSRDGGEYGHYRYAVDEWKHWDNGRFPVADKLIFEYNERFRTIHTPQEEFMIDEYEWAYATLIMDSVVRGIQVANEQGAFGLRSPFLTIWFPDSEDERKYAAEAVRRLNSPEIAEEYLKWVG